VQPGRYVPTVSRGTIMAVTAIQVKGAAQTGQAVDIPETGEVQIRLTVDTSAGDLAGVVTRNGVPQPAAVVMLVQHDGWETFGGYRYDQSDGDGSFTLRAVPRGQYFLFAFDDGEPADYDDPEIIRKWLATAQVVTVTGEPGQTATVEVQSAANRLK